MDTGLVLALISAVSFAIGIVIAFGMTIGTMFTLFVTPAVYTYIAREHRRTAASQPSPSDHVNQPAE
jgi:H+/gluconate symporter-like permease